MCLYNPTIFATTAFTGPWACLRLLESLLIWSPWLCVGLRRPILSSLAGEVFRHGVRVKSLHLPVCCSPPSIHYLEDKVQVYERACKALHPLNPACLLHFPGPQPVASSLNGSYWTSSQNGMVKPAQPQWKTVQSFLKKIRNRTTIGSIQQLHFWVVI